MGRASSFRILISFVLAGMLVSATALAQIGFQIPFAYAERGKPSENENSASAHVPGRLLIKFKENITEEHGNKIFRSEGAEVIEEIPHLAIKVLKVPESAIDRIQTNLQQNENVQFVEKDALFPPQDLTVSPAIPNDPYFGMQWHLAKIGIASAWNISKGENSIIAILDSGVEPNHPDLVDNLLQGYNFYDSNNDWSDIACKHGTVVAGIAAGSTDNALGVASVAWESKILPLRVTDDSCWGSISAMTKAIVYAADNGARVANLSFKIPDASLAIGDASKYMYNKGGFVVIASGNNGEYQDVQDTKEVIHVGATDSRDYVTNFSTYGPFIDFVAPGQGIYTAIWNGQYSYVSGTSDAAPVVSGVLGLMFAANPDATAQQVYDALKRTAVDITSRNDGYNITPIPAGPDYYSGWGRVDAFAAVQDISSLPVIDTEAPIVITSPDLSIEAATKAGSVVNFNTPIATDNIGVISGPMCSPSSGTIFPIGKSTVLCSALDAAGNVGTASFTVSVVDTQAPRVITPSDQIYTTSNLKGVIVTFTVSASDDVDGSLAVNCDPSSGSTFPVGSTLVLCRSSDAAGNTGYASFYVTVILQTSGNIRETVPPTVSIKSPAAEGIVKGTVTISVLALDDSGIAKVEIYIDNKLKTSMSNSPYDYAWSTRSLKDGSHSIRAVAYDQFANHASATTTVQVLNRSK